MVFYQALAQLKDSLTWRSSCGWLPKMKNSVAWGTRTYVKSNWSIKLWHGVSSSFGRNWRTFPPGEVAAFDFPKWKIQSHEEQERIFKESRAIRYIMVFYQRLAGADRVFHAPEQLRLTLEREKLTRMRNKNVFLKQLEQYAMAQCFVELWQELRNCSTSRSSCVWLNKVKNSVAWGTRTYF